MDVRPDGTGAGGNVRWHNIDRLPEYNDIGFRWGSIYGGCGFTVDDTNMTSFKHFPSMVDGDIMVGENRRLTSLASCPPCTGLFAPSTGITTLKDFPKPLGSAFKEVGLNACAHLLDLSGIELIRAERFAFTAYPNMPLLRAVITPHIKELKITRPRREHAEMDMVLTEIVGEAKRIAAQGSKNKAIMRAQDGLVKAGREDLAKW